MHDLLRADCHGLAGSVKQLTSARCFVSRTNRDVCRSASWTLALDAVTCGHVVCGACARAVRAVGRVTDYVDIMFKSCSTT